VYILIPPWVSPLLYKSSFIHCYGFSSQTILLEFIPTVGSSLFLVAPMGSLGRIPFSLFLPQVSPFSSLYPPPPTKTLSAVGIIILTLPYFLCNAVPPSQPIPPNISFAETPSFFPGYYTIFVSSPIHPTTPLL